MGMAVDYCRHRRSPNSRLPPSTFFPCRHSLPPQPATAVLSQKPASSTALPSTGFLPSQEPGQEQSTSKGLIEREGVITHRHLSARSTITMSDSDNSISSLDLAADVAETTKSSTENNSGTASGKGLASSGPTPLTGSCSLPLSTRARLVLRDGLPLLKLSKSRAS